MPSVPQVSFPLGHTFRGDHADETATSERPVDEVIDAAGSANATREVGRARATAVHRRAMFVHHAKSPSAVFRGPVESTPARFQAPAGDVRVDDPRDRRVDELADVMRAPAVQAAMGDLVARLTRKTGLRGWWQKRFGQPKIASLCQIADRLTDAVDAAMASRMATRQGDRAQTARANVAYRLIMTCFQGLPPREQQRWRSRTTSRHVGTYAAAQRELRRREETTPEVFGVDGSSYHRNVDLANVLWALRTATHTLTSVPRVSPPASVPPVQGGHSGVQEAPTLQPPALRPAHASLEARSHGTLDDAMTNAVGPRARFFHRGTRPPFLMSDRGAKNEGLAPLAQAESSELPEPGSPRISPARSNDAWPALKGAMASVPPPPLPQPLPPALTLEETNELFNTVGLGLAELSRRLSAPRSWKERWLPRCLRTRPKPDKNAILKWAKYVGGLAVDMTAGRSDAAGCQTAILDVLRAHADDRYRLSAPSGQARWSWRLKDPKGMFGAAQAQLAQEDAKLGAFWQGQNRPNPSEWARERERLDAASRLLTAFAMGK
ncbi:hypothetical protein [Roseateles sp.]|uniref:hypothetical protein n=1 Tax=Roseateles sp. TaxID=1971397 RepID=UPI002F421548